MSSATTSNVASFVHVVCQSRLLDQRQTEKLTQKLQFRFGDAHTLGQDLVRRGWLTPPQLGQLLAGVGATPAASGFAERKAQSRRRWLMFNIIGGIFIAAMAVVILYVIRDDRLGARDRAEKARIKALDAQAQADLKPLLDGFDKFTIDDATLRKQLHAFRNKYIEAPSALKASELLARLPSPLDNLKGNVAPAEKEPNQPANLVAVLGTRKWKHWSAVRALAVSANGNVFATAADDGVVRLWNRTSGAELAVLATGPTVALSFLPGDNLLAAHSTSGNVSLWNVPERKKHGDYAGPARNVVSAAFTRDGLVAASCQDDGLVKVWELESGRERGVLRGHKGPALSVAFSPDTETVATAGQDGSVILWGQTGNARAQLSEHTDSVHSVAFSADGKYLASGGGANDRNIIIWDAAKGEALQRCVGHEGAVQAIAFSGNAKQLVTGSADQSLRLWELRLEVPKPAMPTPPPPPPPNPNNNENQNADNQNQAPAQNPDTPPPPPPAPPPPPPPPVSYQMTGHSGPVLALALFGDPLMVASAGSDGTLRLWNVARRSQTTEIEGHQGPVSAVAFLDEGELVASGSHDRTVRVWSTQTGAARLQLIGHTAPVSSLGFSPVTRVLASGGFDATLRLWSPNGSAEQGTLAGHAGPVLATAITADGKSLAAGGTTPTYQGSALRIWNPANQKERFDLTGQTEAVSSLAFAIDGQTLAAGSYDGSVRLYEPWTGISRGAVQEKTPVESVAISPDGRFVAAGTHAKVVRVWHGTAFRDKATYDGLSAIARGLAYSPDGQWLAAALQDGKVVVWNTDTDAKQEWQLPGAINGVAFAPDSRHIATANANGTVYILRLAPAPVKRGKQ